MAYNKQNILDSQKTLTIEKMCTQCSRFSIILITPLCMCSLSQQGLLWGQKISFIIFCLFKICLQFSRLIVQSHPTYHKIIRSFYYSVAITTTAFLSDANISHDEYLKTKIPQYMSYKSRFFLFMYLWWSLNT